MGDNAGSVKNGKISECDEKRAKFRVDALLSLCENKHDPMIFGSANNSDSSCLNSYYDIENKEEMERVGGGTIAIPPDASLKG